MSPQGARFPNHPRLAGALDTAGLIYLLDCYNRHPPFTAACLQAKQEPAALFATLPAPTWAEIPGEGENSSGEALAALRDVARLAEAGVSVIVVRHGRKSGGDIGDSARGSSAWGGAADILMSLRRTPGRRHENRRVLKAIGRFDDIPPSMAIELRDRRYAVLGVGPNVEAHHVREALLDCLPLDQARAMLEAQILERLRGRGSRTTLKRVLKELLPGREISRSRSWRERSTRRSVATSRPRWSSMTDLQKLGQHGRHHCYARRTGFCPPTRQARAIQRDAGDRRARDRCCRQHAHQDVGMEVSRRLRR